LLSSTLLSQSVPTCGQELARYKNVPAFSNGEYTGTGTPCEKDRGIYGLRYQCVEYIKRFYAVALGVDVSKWATPSAQEYYQTAGAKGLEAFENGGTEPPAPDDILVFAGGTYGHVAIITRVTDSSVEIIEQNWSKSGVATLSLSSTGGRYTLSPRGRYIALGWLRKFAQPCSTIYNHLLLLYPNTDVTYVKDGVTRRFVGSMSNSLKTTVINAFSNLPNLITDGSAGAVSSTHLIVEIPSPVTKITSLGGNNYWLSNQDIQSDLALFAPIGKYDSVHVVWYNGEHDGVDSFFGLGGVFINNGTTTFSSLISGQGFFWTGLGEAFGEPFLHEWLHGVCRFYESLGYTMPDGDADGAGSHGYTKSPTEGWMPYYRDLMRGQVLEPRLSKLTGITREAWRRGSPTHRCQ
jgi:surface antigen